MPNVKRTKKSTTKRRTKRTSKSGRKYNRKSNNTTTTRTVSIGKPVSDKFFTKLRYSETIPLTLGSSMVSFLMQSSLYDPNYQISTAPHDNQHQPLGHDQLSALYNRYRVYGFKYTVIVVNNTNYPCRIWLRNSDEATIVNDVQLLNERPETQLSTLTGLVATPVKKMTGYHNCPKMHGLTKKEFNMRPEFEAMTTTNPANMSYLILQFLQYDTTVTGSISVQVNLEYYVQYFDPFELTKS